ncbi:MAG TPA: NAD(P)/FAD-dependent oxidoreductase, partial [Ramlibacter sp.]
GGDFGGTWYWNRYPGAQCDIESYIYLPLLEELGTLPRMKYSDADEIFAHSRAIGRHFGLYRDACFHTAVTALHWDEATLRWIVLTDRGDRMQARFACLADGPFGAPKLPAIEGIERFRGRTFHTSRWDYAYTGGSPSQPLARLHDQRVGIVGTGATAIQCVPALAQSAGQLLVFQRTPSAVFARDNRPTDPAWAAALAPGWQAQRMGNFNRVMQGALEEDQVDDALSSITRRFSRLVATAGDRPELAQVEALAEEADFAEMEAVRARVAAIVADPRTAEALKPWYRVFCKRPCFNDAYLQAFNRPNVTLVDTGGKGVNALTETGAIAGGAHHELDCLVFATGFEVGAAYPRRSGFEVHGTGGATLTARWAGGPRTLHGLQASGFPNCFFFGITQGGYTANYTHMLYEQSAHAAHVVGELRRRGRQVAEVTEAAEAAWGAEIRRAAGAGTYLQECTPGYYNNEGQPDASRGPNYYGGGSDIFFRILAEWRATGFMEGLVLRG